MNFKQGLWKAKSDMKTDFRNCLSDKKKVTVDSYVVVSK